MADDVNSKLRQELEAARETLEPQIRGLYELMRMDLSGGLANEVGRQISIREHRRGLIQAVINQLDSTNSALTSLENDGYPDLETPRLIPPLFSELSEELKELETAVGIFKSDNAQTVSIGLGKAEDKPPSEE